MKTITKELNLLDREDLEKAVSEYLGREVSVSEIECTLVHCVPCDTEEPNGAYLELQIGDDSCDSYDLFWDEELDGHYLEGKRLSLDEAWADAEEIFDQDTLTTDDFKSFESSVDGSD